MRLTCHYCHGFIIVYLRFALSVRSVCRLLIVMRHILSYHERINSNIRLRLSTTYFTTGREINLEAASFGNKSKKKKKKPPEFAYEYIYHYTVRQSQKYIISLNYSYLLFANKQMKGNLFYHIYMYLSALFLINFYLCQDIKKLYIFDALWLRLFNNGMRQS